MALIDLSPAEIYVLSLVYENREANVYRILECASKDWKYTTVMTLLSRLYAKGHLKRKKEGKWYVYSPTLNRDDSVRLIVERLFGDTLLNDPSPALHYISKSKKLNAKAKKTLRELLDKLEK